MADNKGLTAAKAARQDEFYTCIEDIEKEMRHYAGWLKGKSVYCNCDNARSAFWRYFHLHFGELGLKRLVSTYYDPGYPVYKREYAGGCDDDVRACHLDMLDDGDFRSPECIELLRQCDVVVTNPPFSLFREYVRILVEHGRKFIILGNLNAAGYKDIFPLFQQNKVWMGPSITSGDRKFLVPEGYPLEAAGCGIDEQGRRFIRVKGVRWFTNVRPDKRLDGISLRRTYIEDRYPKYDNYDAIEVGKVADIPYDYDGRMGVPITFLDKYDPEQFEIVGADFDLAGPVRLEDGRIGRHRFYLKEGGRQRRLYSRIVIRRKA